MSEPEQPGAHEWRDAGEIRAITFRDVYGERRYRVGDGEITRIEKWGKSGMHSEIAYVRVWKGDRLFAELCQHALTGVFFGEPT